MIPGNLPAHMNPGRGTHTGPVTGGYFELSFSGHDLVNTGGTDAEYRFRMPFDCVIYRISQNAVNGGGSPSWVVENETQSTTVLSERLLRAAITSGAYYDSEVTTWGAAPTNTVFSRGDILLITFADSTGSESMNDGTVQISGYVKNHIHVSDAND